MNKGDVEMEDAETQSRKELDSVKAPEDSTPDGAELNTAPLPELDASIHITDDSKKPHEVENGNARLSVDSAVVEEEINAELEQGQQHSQPRKGGEEEEEKEVEMKSGDQIKVDQTRPIVEEINGNGDAEKQDEVKSEANGAAKQQDSARIEAKGDAGLQNEANGEGSQECPPAAENETQADVDFTNAVQEQGSSENGKAINDAVDTMMEVKPASQIDVEEIGEMPASKIPEEEIVHSHIGELPFQLPVSEVPPKKKESLDEVHTSDSGEIAKGLAQVVNNGETEDLVKMELDNKSVLPAATRVSTPEAGGSPFVNKPSPATPDMSLKYLGRKSAGYSGSGEAIKNVYNDFKMAENDDGTPEQQAAFIKELEIFYRQRGVEFKTPKFYGHPLNCYKLWTSVIKLGGYDLVTGTKLWRQVGESFHPPKTCTTVSWTFRIFYEKSLLEYERYKVQNGEVELPAATPPEPSSADIEGNGHLASGSGRARRDAAARAMQGWHAQRLYGIGEDKSPNSMQKRENKIKSIGSLKQKRPNEGEPQPSVKTPRTESPKQLVTTVIDVGPPADWVKINVRETKDCFEVYALVPGLLRKEVRVQSDPAGRLVITGQPEQTENPWGITSFRKVVSLPGRIDPLQTSAVVSLHGRLFVRVPFEQSTNQ